MYNRTMTTESAKIIDALGGVAALSKQLGIRRPTIQAWKKRGIPPKIQLAYPRMMAKGRKLVQVRDVISPRAANRNRG